MEIPEVLREPIKRPEYLKAQAKASTGGAGFGELAKGLTIGLDFLFTTAAGGGLGWLIDYWRKSSPAGLLIGLGIGFVFGVYRLIRHLNADSKPRSKR